MPHLLFRRVMAMLAQQIKRLFDDASLRDEYASRGLQRVEQHFCWERCAERMEKRITESALANADR